MVVDYGPGHEIISLLWLIERTFILKKDIVRIY